ncbi:hypothetical protein BTR22_19245 [Alkalihalophilus pseudofirmus]|uniref:hypothetical protein n=1 Tax=Alkalihalophilus pseudofirmus TaxID=79885 RepID=UPI0009535B71|nr:hypothetical protein BTR22_19245 [Alkalihalophilus pseudofirmus]
MIQYESVQIQGTSQEGWNFAATGVEEVLQNVKMIFTTPAGTVPFDREFGINIDFLDKPIHLAQAMIRMEYAEKIAAYESRARVLEVSFMSDPYKGLLIPKVVIDIDLEAE